MGWYLLILLIGFVIGALCFGLRNTTYYKGTVTGKHIKESYGEYKSTTNYFLTVQYTDSDKLYKAKEIQVHQNVYECVKINDVFHVL